MRALKISTFLFFLLGAFGAGFHLGRIIEGRRWAAQKIVKPAALDRPEPSRAGGRSIDALRREVPSENSASGDDPAARRRPESEDSSWDRRAPEKIIQDLEKAIASGDFHAAHEALHELSISGGPPLSSEELLALGGLLRKAPPQILHGLSRALVLAGGEEGLAVVMDFLEDAEVSLDDRREALYGLAELPPEKAGDLQPALAAFLEKGPPGELQRAAAHVIGRLFRDKGAEVLLGMLEQRSKFRSEFILDALGDIGRPQDAQRFLSLLSGDWSYQEKVSLLRSVERMAQRGNEGSLLLGLLREAPAGASREMVAHALADSSHHLGAGVLRQALKEAAGDARAQEFIARALTRTGGKEALQALVEAAADPEVKLDQRVLARALNDFRGEAAVPVMMDLLENSQDEEILEPLARGIARNGGSEALESMLELLESGQNTWQRRAIARSLEEAGPGALGMDRLLSMLEQERDQEVASSLARTLSRLYPQALGEQAGELFQNAASPVKRIAFAQLLEKQAPASALEQIGRQLRVEPDARARWEMARILGRLGDDGVTRAAEILGQETDERRRHSMLWGLEASRRPGPPSLRDLFLQLAKSDPSPAIRGQAAEILGRQAVAEAAPALQDLLSAERDPQVRERIQQALRDLAAR